MKILVFGAGVLGCNLARNFFRAGKDVTLLARGAWGESIPKNGLRIKDKFSPRMSVSRIPVTAELKAEDKYDVIFVVLRYTQLDAILDTLRTNPTKNIVFVGNDMRASALSASLPEKNVMFAFASSAGHREREYVASVDLKKLKGNTAYLSRLIDANIEGYRAIKNADMKFCRRTTWSLKARRTTRPVCAFLSSCPPRASERSARPTTR